MNLIAGKSACYPTGRNGLPISKSSQLSRPVASMATRAISGHNYPDRFKVWISGQVPHVTKAIRREMRRRAGIYP